MTTAPADSCAAPDGDRDVWHWRAPGAAALGTATATGLAALGLTAALQAPSRTTAAALAAAVLGAWASIAVLVRPSLTAHPGGLVIRNPLHTVRVPWTDLRGIDTGMSLVVRTDTRRVTVWAVPARIGRPRRSAARRLNAAFGVPAVRPRRRGPVRATDTDTAGRRPADRCAGHDDLEMGLVAEQLRTRWHLHHPSGTAVASAPQLPGTTVRPWPGAAVPPLVLAALLVLLR